MKKVALFSLLIVLVIGTGVVSADRDVRHLVRHDFVRVRDADMPCVEDPSGVSDYTLTTSITLLVDHQDEGDAEGYEHVVDVQVGEFSAVPRFDPSLPSYEGRSLLLQSFQIQPGDDNTAVVLHFTIRVLAHGTDGSVINFRALRTLSVLNGEILSETEQFFCH